ncbi:MAG TPA: response regulator [Verrucomicrobiae bacterium]|nr:response regulator [Verrucomicrobiae bacterium]
MKKNQRSSDMLQKCLLDRPPDGETILRALNPRPVTAPIEGGLHERILVVESDADTRHIFVLALTLAGYRVDAVEDGEAAWSAIRSAAGSDGYQLLITDNPSPEQSGVELIRRLRRSSIELPVVLAAGTMPEDIDPLHLAGFLAKPFLQARLIQLVREVLHTAKTVSCDASSHDH